MMVLAQMGHSLLLSVRTIVFKTWHFLRCRCRLMLLFARAIVVILWRGKVAILVQGCGVRLSRRVEHVPVRWQIRTQIVLGQGLHLDRRLLHIEIHIQSQVRRVAMLLMLLLLLLLPLVLALLPT